MFLYLTLYIQDVLDYSPLQAGLRFLPLTVLGFFVAPIAGKLSSRIPIRVLLGVGMTLVGLGLLLMHGISVDSSWTTLLAGFVVAGAGIGMTNPGIAQTAIGVVPPQRAGMGSGINNTFRQVGIATGVASLGAVFQSQISSRLSEQLPNAPSGLADVVASGGLKAAVASTPQASQHQVEVASKAAFIGAMNDILLIAGLISLAGAALGFALVRSSDFVAHGEAQAAPGPAEPEAEAQPAAV
jgi:MFS family permease